MAKAIDYINRLAEAGEPDVRSEQKAAPDLRTIGSRAQDLEVGLDGKLDNDDEISIETYRKMRRDPQVKACLLVLKLPLLQTDWQITAKTEQGKEIAAWTEWALNDMEDSVPYYLREMLTALDFGHSVTEKIWQLRTVPLDPSNMDGGKWDQRIIPQKLKTYDPRSLTFKLKPVTGQLEGVIQRQRDGSEAMIPARKLLVYTHEKEFGDWHGEAALRAAYKPWIIKEFLQRFWNVALERYGAPFSTMEIPGHGDITTGMKLMDLLKTKTGVPLPEGYKMTIHNLANTGMSYKEAILYQDTMIARSMLIPDLIFGNAETGAFALSKTHAGFFIKRLNGIAQEVSDIITKYLIRDLVSYNYADVKEFPEFRLTDVSEDDMKLLLDIVNGMISGKVIAPQESWIRERLGLPEADPESQAYLDKQRAAAEKGMDALGGEDPGDDDVDPDDPEDKKKSTDPKDLDKTKGKPDPDKKKKGIEKNAELGGVADYLTTISAAGRKLLLGGE